jgi:hypothetical protein
MRAMSHSEPNPGNLPTSRPTFGIQRTLRNLDQYYARLLECQEDQFHTGSWAVVGNAPGEDSITRVFGMRLVLYLLAPLYQLDGEEHPSGVAVLAPQLRAQAQCLLESADPGTLYRDRTQLRALSRIVRRNIHPIAPGSSSQLAVYYVAKEKYIPFCDPWLDWIEPLDKRSETDPYSMALLTTYSGGVFVARIHDAIGAYIGLQAYSKRIWELSLPRMTPYTHASAMITIKDQENLLAALVARATCAAFKSGAIPICTAPGDDERIRRIFLTVGYQQYANASIYATVTA